MSRLNAANRKHQKRQTESFQLRLTSQRSGVPLNSKVWNPNSLSQTFEEYQFKSQIDTFRFPDETRLIPLCFDRPLFINF